MDCGLAEQSGFLGVNILQEGGRCSPTSKHTASEGCEITASTMEEMKQGNLVIATESRGKAFQGDDDVLALENHPYCHCYNMQKDHTVLLVSLWAVSYAIVVHEIKKLLYNRRNYKHNIDSLQNSR